MNGVTVALFATAGGAVINVEATGPMNDIPSVALAVINVEATGP